MAPSTSAAKPIKKILDATKISALTSKLVRRPIDVKSQVPIQGRPREANSNAFKEASHRETVRLQKALNAVAHGKHIFVYHNVRTKQVVYSLTRYLEKTNLLRQMVYHGKKTVPAELRRDMWVPYYSVHFGDARLGLRAYQLLREFSMQRQFSPPAEMITVTKEYLDKKRPKDPLAAEEFDKMNKKRIGHPMEKKERARVLMDQKATSVADIAAVLAIQEKAIANGLLEQTSKRGYLTRKARQRRRAALERLARQQQWNAEHIAALEKRMSDLSGDDVEIGEVDGEYPADAKDVKILWRDVHDAYFAESWPADVQHGELELKRSAIIGSELRPEGEEVVTEHEFNERKEKQ
ncbi:uncharacterized protein N7469_001331 [Penicillium citrinum]|uniref:Large ribosomal subunit protein mL67 n=2 Tax=Penicillium TaxID=5073 RepID=A0A9W9PEB4_PENCI|nr:uncharacterized protein N7469_001331 [Penicillium citrinum]KAJ5243004.1 hypothetical protein N7469_001331 [Penicillium citrinum]KAJ5599492.1 hypothetical protein N7450_000559 [Penicillium hetheringtonii]